MVKYKVLIDENKIKTRVAELGQVLTKDYQGKNPIVICVLKGGIIFFTDLIRRINTPLEIDFVRFSSYRNGAENGELRSLLNVTTDIKNRDVLIVEDIVDSGKTLSFFVSVLEKQKPSSIKVCALLDKKDARKVPFTADYVGFEIANSFVIGYGLDYNELYRELPFIAVITDID